MQVLYLQYYIYWDKAILFSCLYQYYFVQLVSGHLLLVNGPNCSLSLCIICFVIYILAALLTVSSALVYLSVCCRIILLLVYGSHEVVLRQEQVKYQVNLIYLELVISNFNRYVTSNGLHTRNSWAWLSSE